MLNRFCRHYIQMCVCVRVYAAHKCDNADQFRYVSCVAAASRRKNAKHLQTVYFLWQPNQRQTKNMGSTVTPLAILVRWDLRFVFSDLTLFPPPSLFTGLSGSPFQTLKWIMSKISVEQNNPKRHFFVVRKQFRFMFSCCQSLRSRAHNWCEVFTLCSRLPSSLNVLHK